MDTSSAIRFFRETEGWLFRDQDRTDYLEAVGRDIVSFFTAVRIGLRDEWIAEFFSPLYPTDVDDEGIITDIIGVHDVRITLSVAECEQCGRLHVQREPCVNSYRSYAPDELGYAGVLQLRVATDVEPGAAADGGGI